MRILTTSFGIWIKHWPLHKVVPLGQVQVPLLHDWPAAQTVPQVPQFAVFDRVSTHAPLQLVSPAPHTVVHWLAEHTWVAPHAIPQAPQFFGSLVKSTHAPLHDERPGGQLHWPLSHGEPTSQRMPQVPQLFTSLRTSVQKPEHDTCGGAHWLTHAPAAQAWLASHTTLQPPQLKRSDWVSTQL